MTDQANDHRAKARGILESQMAEGLAAIEKNKTLTADIEKMRTLVVLAEERVRTQNNTLRELSNERDFYMRYGATVSARLDSIFDAVKTAAVQIADAGAAFDSIVKIGREQGDRAHNAYLLLSSLMGTIQAAKVDARDASYRPRIEVGAGVASRRPTEIAAPADGGEPADKDLPSIVRQGPRSVDGEPGTSS